MTHYETLNLKADASEKDIKTSFRKLAAKYHPDKNNGNKQAEEKFKKINEAYQILSDKKEKEMYDAALKRGETDHNFRGTYGDSPFSGRDGQTMDDFIRNTFKTYRDNGNFDTTRDSGNFGGFEDIFNFKSKQPEPKVNLNLTFWEAALGCNKLVYLPESIIKGKLKTKIKIEPGTEDGTILSVKVKNVEFEIKIKIQDDPSNKFGREKLNLYTSVDVPMTTAILGGKITFPHWTKDVEVTIPEGIKNGQKLRLKGLGINKNNESGHLFLIINIVMPEKLTEKQKTLLKEFAEIEKKKSL